MLLFALSVTQTPEDRSKLTEIYDRYFLRMYNYAVSRLTTVSEAEDAVQEAFLSLAKNMDRIGDPASRAAAGYVMTTLKSKIADIVRKKNKEKNAIDKIGNSLIAERYDGFFEDQARSERTEELKKAVSTLDGRERHILLLRLYEEMSFSLIAQRTGINEGTVKNVYYRAIGKLRKILGGKNND